MKRAPWKPVALLRSCQWTLSTETLVRRTSHQRTLNITDRTSLHMTSSDSQRSNAESCPRPKRRRRGNRLAGSSSPLEPKSDCECSTTLASLDLWRTLANTKKNNTYRFLKQSPKDDRDGAESVPPFPPLLSPEGFRLSGAVGFGGERNHRLLLRVC